MNLFSFPMCCDVTLCVSEPIYLAHITLTIYAVDYRRHFFNLQVLFQFPYFFKFFFYKWNLTECEIAYLEMRLVYKSALKYL